MYLISEKNMGLFPYILLLFLTGVVQTLPCTRVEDEETINLVVTGYVVGLEPHRRSDVRIQAAAEDFVSAMVLKTDENSPMKKNFAVVNEDNGKLVAGNKMDEMRQGSDISGHDTNLDKIICLMDPDSQDSSARSHTATTGMAVMYSMLPILISFISY